MSNSKRKKTVLILGAGFAGCTAAHLFKKNGFKVTVLEKEKFPGGGCFTHWYGGHPYTLGPRVFFSKDKETIKLITSLVKIRQFYIKTWSYLAVDQKFYHYPIYAGDLSKMPDWKKIKVQLKERKNKEPRVNSFENYWLDAIGPNLYQKFIDSYSKKMWGIKTNKELSTDFAWVNKGNPIRAKDTRLCGDIFQGYPFAESGYNSAFDKMLKGCKVIYGCDVKLLSPGAKKIKTNKGEFKGDIIVNTLSVDSLFNNVYGKLKYSGRTMLKMVLPTKQIIPRDISWIHYSGEEPFTRVTEFKKITGYRSNNTLLGIEMPNSKDQHYPLPVDRERAKFRRYQKLFPKDFYSIGRLGSYTYKGISGVMGDAMEVAKKILSNK